MQSLGSRSVVAPLGQAQRKRRMATICLTSNTEIESRQMAREQDFTELIIDSSNPGPAFMPGFLTRPHAQSGRVPHATIKRRLAEPETNRESIRPR